MTKDTMLAEMDNLLHSLGYTGNLLQSDYSFASSQSDDGMTLKPSRIARAAFARTRHSVQSACHGVAVVDEKTPEAAAAYRSLGAPQLFTLHLSDETVIRWKVTANALPHRIEQHSFDELPALFKKRHDEWTPEAILRAKAIAFSDPPPQLDFYDAGYLPTLGAELRDKLSRDLDKIVAECSATYKKQYSQERFEAELPSLFAVIFRLLAAKFLIDTGIQPNWATLTVDAVIDKAQAYLFPNEMPPALLQHSPTREQAWQKIRIGLNLANLSADTLAHIYENTLVTSDLRKQYSFHATPPAIAEYVLRRLPLEKLPENERTIFEPFCGHAPFLIAGLGRLRSLLSGQLSIEDQHIYFQRMLSGMETSPFSREIARASLILADDLHKDHWNISDGDVFQSSEFDTMLQQANIVVCNPPHQSFSPQERGELPEEHKVRKDAEALQRILAHPPRMLAIVLPRAFLNGRGYRSLRDAVIKHYRCTEIGIFPETVFAHASQETVVLIAHNETTYPFERRSFLITSADYSEFVQHGESKNPIVWHDERHTPEKETALYLPASHALWTHLAGNDELDSWVEGHTGLQYQANVMKRIFEEETEFARLGVDLMEDCFDTLAIPHMRYLETRKETMHDKAYEQDWHLSKVLVNAARASRDYWRIAGAPFEGELWATKRFYGLWARNDIPLELIAAVVSSPVANAFVYEWDGLRDNALHTIRNIPVPHVSNEQAELIVALVEDYQDTRYQWLETPEEDTFFSRRCTELLLQIDAAVMEAYALPAILERELLLKFEGKQRRPLPFDFPGYGVEYEEAKKINQRMKQFRRASKRYHELASKESFGKLPADEQNEIEHLRHEIERFVSQDSAKRRELIAATS